jgi:8-oxo-dGTP pyrophosphatase MutT (NUDIX family)
MKNIQNISYYDISNIVMNNIHKFNQYNQAIKFMLVNRRHSLNYIDFIRGKYDEKDDDYIMNMCSYMSKNEIELIKNNSFNDLWVNLWLKNAHKKKYNDEMNLSRTKFNYIKNNNLFTKITSDFEQTEWEVPKGRKNFNETNINCAIREFKEETSIIQSQYFILNCLDPIHDIFTGTDNKQYRHIFYTSVINNDIDNIDYHSNEINSVKWFNWSDLHNIIRPYNQTKINILTSIFIFIVNVCEMNNETLIYTSPN